MVRKLWQGRGQRGDTLVEVLMAIVIISVVIVGAITMMNRGLAAAEIALEHSQVRLMINDQIDMLRFARDRYVLVGPSSASARRWQTIATNATPQAITYDDTCNVTTGKSPFYMSIPGNYVEVNTYTPSQPASLPSAGDGLWIESVSSPASVSPAYIDFVIRACWQGSGTTGQQRTVTAVRLYDPTR